MNQTESATAELKKARWLAFFIVLALIVSSFALYTAWTRNSTIKLLREAKDASSFVRVSDANLTNNGDTLYTLAFMRDFSDGKTKSKKWCCYGTFNIKELRKIGVPEKVLIVNETFYFDTTTEEWENPTLTEPDSSSPIAPLQ